MTIFQQATDSFIVTAESVSPGLHHINITRIVGADYRAPRSLFEEESKRGWRWLREWAKTSSAIFAQSSRLNVSWSAALGVIPGYTAANAIYNTNLNLQNSVSNGVFTLLLRANDERFANATVLGVAFLGVTGVAVVGPTTAPTQIAGQKKMSLLVMVGIAAGGLCGLFILAGVVRCFKRDSDADSDDGPPKVPNDEGVEEDTFKPAAKEDARNDGSLVGFCVCPCACAWAAGGVGGHAAVVPEERGWRSGGDESGSVVGADDDNKVKRRPPRGRNGRLAGSDDVMVFDGNVDGNGDGDLHPFFEQPPLPRVGGAKCGSQSRSNADRSKSVFVRVDSPTQEDEAMSFEELERLFAKHVVAGALGTVADKSAFCRELLLGVGTGVLAGRVAALPGLYVCWDTVLTLFLDSTFAPGMRRPDSDVWFGFIPPDPLGVEVGMEMGIRLKPVPSDPCPGPGPGPLRRMA